MPSVAVKLYSVFFKFLLKHRLQNRIQTPHDDTNPFGVTTRPEESVSAPNPSFADGVATKDIHIDPFTSLSIRIFLPESALNPPEPDSKPNLKLNPSLILNGLIPIKMTTPRCLHRQPLTSRLYAVMALAPQLQIAVPYHRPGKSLEGTASVAAMIWRLSISDRTVLAPENRYPAAFDDGLKVLNWLGKQANLAECSKSMGNAKGGTEFKKADIQRHIVDSFGASMVEPWLAAHGDPSRCVLLGVSCGANIADYVARKAVEAGKLLDPVKVVAQVLMYPFFIGSVPTHSEIKLANSYFYDKQMCMLAWKLFLPEEEFSLDHPAANPLVPGRGPPLKHMPPTLTVVAEHDWMRDRAIAYSEELRKVNVDAPVLEYKDAVHEFATLDMLLKTPQAQACAEDIAIWVKKYISLRGHEFSY
ncbi:hypothetical protein GH714_041819 [Hevea brasiliensis]|uniref:Alpha/beta hydrolase fold-3 domain-containing protein n=1 Tax=Hevea brasiliensis TaxID=3981 RepID=A0A6A6MVQ8_HEVBR|nr:hypothetical protein GH714_041819 [Hevea brasiliensis]